jgi:putative NADH-flavin reductase
MPVIVIGADTAPGAAILDTLYAPDREVRAFVTDPGVASKLKALGVKVALGDVSDDSHIEGAALNCFSAVLVAEAARDGRERSFADTEPDVLQGWARAVGSAGIRRVIWVYEGEPPPVKAPEVAIVSPEDEELGARVAALDDALVIEPNGSDDPI